MTEVDIQVLQDVKWNKKAYVSPSKLTGAKHLPRNFLSRLGTALQRDFYRLWYADALDVSLSFCQNIFWQTIFGKMLSGKLN